MHSHYKASDPLSSNPIQPTTTKKIRDLPSIYKTEEKSSRSKQTCAPTCGNYSRKHSPRRWSYQVPDLQHSGIDQQKGNHKLVDRRPIYSPLQKTMKSECTPASTRLSKFRHSDSCAPSLTRVPRAKINLV